MTGPIDIGDVTLWVEQRGAGPDVLLIAGLSDTTEAWSFQRGGRRCRRTWRARTLTSAR